MTFDPLADAVDATRLRLHHLDRADHEQKRRHRDYRMMHDDGMSGRQIAAAMHGALLSEGFSDEQIRAAGISHDNISLALR